MSIFSVTCSRSLAYLLSMLLLYFCFYTRIVHIHSITCCFFRSLVYGIELILIRIAILHLLGSYSYSRLILIPISRRTHTYSDSLYAVSSLYIYEGTYTHTGTSIYLVLVQISRRSYRAYTYTEVPLGTTELILVFRILYLYYGAYPCLTDNILVLRSLFLYFGSYTCITEHILVFRILYLYYRCFACITILILILQNLYLYYRYGSTRRYYRDFSCTKVPVGTT